MRRFPPLIIGFILIAAPLSADAALDCAQLRDVDPISTHYVGPALERARNGIEYAAEARANTDFFSYYLPGWAHSVAGSFAALVDSRQSLTERASDLSDTTACLRYDQILLECAIDDVREALDTEIERGSFIAIMRLQSALLFLQERLQHLQSGSTNETYADPSWERRWLFDKEPPEALTGPLCPFHSDYTPPSSTGYGCDATVLQHIQSQVPADALPFIRAELDGLTALKDEIRSFQEAIPEEYRNAGDQVEVLYLETSASGGPVHASWYCRDKWTNSLDSEPKDQNPPAGWCFGFRLQEHQTTAGCPTSTAAGKCSRDPDVSCESNDDCAPEGNGSCLRDDRSAIPTRTTRGVFSYPRDHLRLLVDFVQKRINDGLSRTFPPGWARIEDLPEDGPDAERREQDDAALAGGRTAMRIFFRSVSGIQGRLEGTIFPEAQDSQLEIARALSDMRSSIGELSRLASQPTGVRSFVAEFAYFLRRTCMFRPCQQSLEQIIRISLADACFPYTNGAFLGGGPAWKQCALAACIQVDDEEGDPLELSDECEEILPDEEE